MDSRVHYRSSCPALFRYDRPEISERIVAGTIKVSTLDACRRAENPQAADPGEGSKVTTSLPGVDHPDARSFAKLLGVDASGISLSENSVKLVGAGAVRRTESTDAFVYCTSSLESDLLRERFGRGCVKITDPVAFFEAIDAVLRTGVSGRLGRCVVDHVEYGSRENNYRDHTDRHGAFLKPSGPPRHFERESEVRAIWLPDGFMPEPVTLEVPGARSVVELLR